jgi:hypothetical protein
MSKANILTFVFHSEAWEFSGISTKLVKFLDHSGMNSKETVG